MDLLTKMVEHHIWLTGQMVRLAERLTEEHESLSSMRERLASEGPTYLSHVRDVVAADRLDDTFVDALCEPAEVFTYGGMIADGLTLAAHRRTRVVLASGRHGVENLGWGDPIVWVAQPG